MITSEHSMRKKSIISICVDKVEINKASLRQSCISSPVLIKFRIQR
uniref:Uncharacterized protein n=1 Tax=Arundo donax TaxID=35708 RepID=A0A0A9CFI6_ARUDO